MSLIDEEITFDIPDDYVVRMPPVREYTILCYSNIALRLEKFMRWFYLHGQGQVIDECPFCGGSLDGRCYCYG